MSASKQLLHFGILSTANINKHIIPGIRASPNAALVGVASRTQEAAAAYAEKWEIPRAFGSYDELLDSEDIDAVYIPLPNAYHKEWCIKAMRKGKHVLCEKPMALVEADVEEMFAVAAEENVFLLEAFMWLYLGQTAKLQKLLWDDKVIGDVQSITSAFTFTLGRDGHRSGSLNEGGGSIWDVGVYPLSFARVMFRAEPTEVFCKATYNATSGADDCAFALVSFPDGRVLSMESSFQSTNRMTADIFGSTGSIHTDNAFKAGKSNRLVLKKSDGATEEFDPNETLGHVYQGEVDFLARVVAEKTIAEELKKAKEFSIANVRAVLALHESASTGHPVKLVA